MTDKISRINTEHEFAKDFGLWIVGVDKVGGGTVGREYEGSWTVTLYTNMGDEFEVVPVTTGMPHSHEWVSDLVSEDFMGEM